MFVRSCIELDKDRDKNSVLTAWLGSNLDPDGVKDYLGENNLSSGKSSNDSGTNQAGWNKLARTLRTTKLH